MALKAYENMAACVIEELKKRNMEGYYCEDRKAAADRKRSRIWEF